jgi:hypothetical protein
MYVGLGVLLAGRATAPYALLPALAAGGIGRVVHHAVFTEALHRVEPHETGSAAGLLNAVQQFGGTLGVAGFGTIYLHHPVAVDRSVWVADCGRRGDGRDRASHAIAAFDVESTAKATVQNRNLWSRAVIRRGDHQAACA